MIARYFSLLIALIVTSNSWGDDAPQLAEQPVFVARFNGWNQKGFEAYIRELNNDLQVGKNLTEAIDKNPNNDAVAPVEAPATGFLVYLAKGLIPSVEQIQYSEVGSLEEFEKAVREQKKLFGEMASLDGSNEKYKIVQTVLSRIDITDKSTEVSNSPEASGIKVKQVSSSKTDATTTDDEPDVPEAQQTRIMLGPLGFSSSSVENDGKIVEENGRRYRDNSYKTTTWFRYHDGFMFTGTSNALWEMNPPTAELLRDQNNADLNGHLAFYPDRIPEGFRQLAWNALNTTIGTELQQGDDESSEDYLMRRTSGEAGLALIQATMFDTQEVSAWMKFASGDEPVRGELKINARNNSNLGKSLREFAAANSRFAPILKDDAAATVHIAFNLSDDWKKAVETVRTSFNSHLNDAPEAAIAEMREIIHSLTSSSEHGTVEAMVKLGWSKESGGVIYGGIHADENDKLLDSVFAMANIDGSGFDRIEKGEMQLLVAELPDDYQSELVRLTHVYVAHVNSCLWFAIGGENAHEIIRLSVDRCSKSDGPIQTPLLTTALDFEKLISYPQDDPTGLTAVAPVCFASIDGLIKNYTFTRSVDSEESESESDSNADLAFRALQLGGSKQLSLTVDADESGLVVRGTLGNALVRAVMAPTIGMFDRLVQTSQTSSEGEVEVSPTEPETR